MFFDPAFAAEQMRMWQTVSVTPYTNYSYTFDFYMEEGFKGTVRCSVYSTDYLLNMGGLISPDIDQLIADSSSFGSKQCKMTLSASGQASVYQTATVLCHNNSCNIRRKC